MKLVCNRVRLLETVNTALAVVWQGGKRSLENIELRACEDRLTIAATDLEMSIRCDCTHVQVEALGVAVVPANILRDIIRESSDDVISLELCGGRLHIKGYKSRFKIFTEKDAFPFDKLPAWTGKTDFEIEGQILKPMIRQTIFAIAREATRYAFNGVQIIAKGRKILAAGCDGRRLALATGDAITAKNNVEGIVPGKALSVVEKFFGDQVVYVEIGKDVATFYTPGITFITHLCGGQFPPYDDVIPKSSIGKMTAPTSDFSAAVRQARLLTTCESKAVRFAFSKSGLVLSTRDPETGESRIEMPCKFEGDDIEIGFNPDFLLDALSAVDTDAVSFELTPGRPGLLRAGSDFSYVVMNVNA